MIAYFDCFSGISGDMTLGALAELGVPVDWLARNLKDQLGLDDFQLTARRVKRCGISATSVSVEAENGPERDYQAISQMIAQSRLAEPVRRMSLAMFDRLAEAEAKIHECEKARVHFHEVGGVDAIVDMVGTAMGIDYLGIEKVFASPLPLGSGTVTCSHGTLPVPAPATAALLKGVPVYGSQIPFELVTPTGAAIITTLARDFGPVCDMVVENTGYGAGSRDLEARANVLRIITGSSPDDGADAMVMVETCIDDMNPEIYAYVSDRWFADGARDVYMVPVYMKKGRPGVLLQVLCDSACQQDVMSRILSETSAIGVRYYPVSRRVLERRAVAVSTPYGEIAAKQVKTPEGGWRVAPEYESCRRAAEACNVALRTVYESALACFVHDGSQKRQ